MLVTVERTSEEMPTHVAGIVAFSRFVYSGKIAIVMPPENAPPSCQGRSKSEIKRVKEE
jgi:hypothetical protein